jgi:hypothetical protein
MTGITAGDWTVIVQDGNQPGGGALWRCVCRCGTERRVLGADLRNGKSTNCGCRGAARLANLAATHRETGTRIYRIWKNMRGRCRNPRNPQYPRYGGRGISICQEWNDYPAFRDWALAHGYRDDLSIERVDVNGNYCPANCTWADAYTQSRNRRFVTRRSDGVPWVTIAAENGITAARYNNRVYAGWTREAAASEPIGTRIAPARLRNAKGRFA